MTALDIKEREVADLHPYERNPRTHSEGQIRQIAASIQKFGFNNPVLVDDSGRIIAGHGRVEAAKLLGLTTVPTVELAHLNDSQRRAYVIADNRLAELAGWDDEILSIELQELAAFDLDFDLTDLGFTSTEIDQIIGKQLPPEEEHDDLPVLPRHKPISGLGDLWQIGPHRLFCGDALSSDSYQRLLTTERAQMVFTDPPYNLPIDRFVTGLGKAKHQEFSVGSGELSSTEFTAFLTTAFANLTKWSANGSIHFVMMDWRHLAELLEAGRRTYTELKNLCVWVKSKGGMGRLYRSQHELIAVFKNGSAPHINEVDLGKNGRYRTNVWNYAIGSGPEPDRRKKSTSHPTVKPIAMVADAILDCSRRGDLILDCFAGSGTTLLAAHRTGRKCYAIELEPKYVDLALTRLTKATGIEPICSATGESFSVRQQKARKGNAHE